MTIQQLLTHTAGFIPDNPMSDYEGGVDAVRQRLLRLLPNQPGERFVYSDVGYQLLGELIRIKTGQDVGGFAKANIFEPLGMNDTMFLPIAPLKKRAAALAKRLRGIETLASVEVVEDIAFVGGGSLPDQQMKTWVVEVKPREGSDADFAQRLRTGSPAVMGRVRDGKILLDLRTILPYQVEALVNAIATSSQ